MSDPHRIETLEQLREVIPDANPVVETKVFDHVDSYAAAFIERAPIVFVATSGADGRLDVSPKGDAPGFVLQDDPHTLWLPERPGNRLAMGFRNLLERPRIALIFVVPGVTETLRVSGSAFITRDPEILDRLAARGKPAVLATRVAVEQSFFHCGKAFIRSALWKAESWPDDVKVSFGRQLADKANADATAAAAIDRAVEEDYQTGLY